MAKAIDISAPKGFNIHGDPTNLGANWKKWKQSFEVYLIAAGINDDNQKKALLLHCAGEAMIELHNTLPEPENLPDNPTEYTKTVKKLDNHFIPRQNK